jgi:guanylate kinase
MSSKDFENKGKAIIFSAPSGAGKTTIVHYLLENLDSLDFSISATSREPRKVEREGKDYYYLSVEEFRKRIESGDFIEWEEVYKDQYYGTLRSEIDRIWSNGKHVVFDVDVVGGLNIKKFFGDAALAIFVKPPSIETLRKRLETRKTESEESIRKRLDKSAREMAYADSFDVVLVNDDLKTACKKARELVLEFIA